ncbi:diaminopimelate decarboxylase [soil metagenome]
MSTAAPIRYERAQLFIEGRAAEALAREFGTPLYVYSHGELAANLRAVQEAFGALAPRICFAVKACPNLHILRALGDLGAGMDVVSEGELARADAAGIPRDRITFAGVGKTEAALRAALGAAAPGDSRTLTRPPAPVGLLNIESEPEYERASALARELNLHAAAALRINPEIPAGGHAHLTTAAPDSKFGVSLSRARTLLTRAHRDPHLPITGLHVHLGSAIDSVAPFADAARRVAEFVRGLEDLGIVITTLDLGGGFAVDYTGAGVPTLSDYAAALVPHILPLAQRGVRVILEPGRIIAASAGVLLTRVEYVKRTETRTFAICDAGMNALLRPALYGAEHAIWPTRCADAAFAAAAGASPIPRRHMLATREAAEGYAAVEVVGPLCESGDILGRGRMLPPIKAGDVLAVFDAGAYGMSMASRYNTHPLAAEVLVEGDRARLVRRRETIGDVLAHELDMTA